jgi:hypothetical protein
MSTVISVFTEDMANRNFQHVRDSNLDKNPSSVRSISVPYNEFTKFTHRFSNIFHMPSLQREIHHHKPNIMSEGTVSVIQTTILWDNPKDTLTNKERATINGCIPRDNIRELNKSSPHTRSSHLAHMITSFIEEAADQSSVTDELFRVRWQFKDNIGPVIIVEEWSSAEDMKTLSAAMSTWRDEIRPKRKVRARVTVVVCHRQCMEIGMAGGRRLGWRRKWRRNRGGLCRRSWNGKVHSRRSKIMRFSFNAKDQCLGSLG